MAQKGPPERGQNDYTPSADTVAMLKERAKFVRLETVRLIDIAKAGHYTSAFSAAEIFASLFYDVMTVRRGEPQVAGPRPLPDGQGPCGGRPVSRFSPIWASSPRPGSTTIRASAVRSATIPDMRKVPGIDFSSGSIGHALSGGLGMCLAQRYTGESYTVFALLGDGEMQEGQVWEAALSAAHHKASKLVAIIDRNGFQLDGKVDDVIGIEPLDEKWRSFGWEVHTVNGHDASALTELLRRVKADTTRDVRPASSPRRSRARASPTWRRSPAGIWATSIPRMPHAPSPKSMPRRSRDERSPVAQFLAVSRRSTRSTPACPIFRTP